MFMDHDGLAPKLSDLCIGRVLSPTATAEEEEDGENDEGQACEAADDNTGNRTAGNRA